MFKRIIVLGAFMAVLLPQAHASLIYSLTVDGCTVSCGAGPFGQVQLDQTSSTVVTVTVTLIPGEVFAGTGAGDALEFNVAGPITIGVNTPGFAIGPAPDTASTFGSFLESVTCTACQGGQITNPSGPLSFTVTKATGLSITDFVANNGGYFFASDIAGVNGNTGNVAAVGSTQFTSTPEPVSASFIGIGLVGIAIGFKRIQGKK